MTNFLSGFEIQICDTKMHWVILMALFGFHGRALADGYNVPKPQSKTPETKENTWWLHGGAFQKPPNHPGVVKGDVSQTQSPGSVFLQTPSPECMLRIQTDCYGGQRSTDRPQGSRDQDIEGYAIPVTGTAILIPTLGNPSSPSGGTIRLVDGQILGYPGQQGQLPSDQLGYSAIPSHQPIKSQPYVANQPAYAHDSQPFNPNRQPLYEAPRQQAPQQPQDQEPYKQPSNPATGYADTPQDPKPYGQAPNRQHPSGQDPAGYQPSSSQSQPTAGQGQPNENPYNKQPQDQGGYNQPRPSHGSRGQGQTPFGQPGSPQQPTGRPLTSKDTNDQPVFYNQAPGQSPRDQQTYDRNPQSSGPQGQNPRDQVILGQAPRAQESYDIPRSPNAQRQSPYGYNSNGQKSPPPYPPIRQEPSKSQQLTFDRNPQTGDVALGYQPPVIPYSPPSTPSSGTGNVDSAGVDIAYPGCPAAMICVPENYCDGNGVSAGHELHLTFAQKHFRVALSSCSFPTSEGTGVCCRDPDYKDPWPMMSGNPEIADSRTSDPNKPKNHHNHGNPQAQISGGGQDGCRGY